MQPNPDYLTDRLREALTQLTRWQKLQVYAIALIFYWRRRFTVGLALAWLKVAKAI